MVNCKNCGAPLSLDQATCPYCGTENKEAIEHIRKLKSLEKTYRNAQKEVSEEVFRSRRSYGPLIVLVIVLLANLIMLPLHGASYEFAERINVRKYSIEEISAKLDEYLENGKYAQLHEFMDHYDLRYSDFPDYYPLYNLCTYYTRILDYMSDFRYDAEYYTDPLVKACEAIKDYQDEHKYSVKRIENERFKRYAQEIDAEYELVLKTFFKFTDEDIASMDELTSAELVVLATRRLNNEE